MTISRCACIVAAMTTDSVTKRAMRVADQVRAEVARSRVSRATLAEGLGVSSAAVSRRLLGQVPITAGELATIADLLQVPVSRLIVDPDHAPGRSLGRAS